MGNEWAHKAITTVQVKNSPASQGESMSQTTGEAGSTGTCKDAPENQSVQELREELEVKTELLQKIVLEATT